MLSLTPRGLQAAINTLERESKELGLEINLQKTKIMVYRLGGYLGKNERFFLNSKEISVVNAYKYLGLTLTTKLSFEIALAEIVGKAKYKMVQIMKTMFSLGYLDPEIYFQLFDQTVRPMLTYSCEVWGLEAQSALEKVHTMACKKLLGVKKKTPNCLVYGEVGRFPLALDTQARVISYWFKILQMENDRIPKMAYLRDVKEIGKKGSWAQGVKGLLERPGFAGVWLNQGVTNQNSFLRDFKLRLRDIYM